MRAIVAALAIILLYGCGQMGPLYMPTDPDPAAGGPAAGGPTTDDPAAGDPALEEPLDPTRSPETI
jgi:predicted small lipoprotein YifL